MKPRWLALLLLAFAAQALAVERVVSLAPSLSEIVVELGAADLWWACSTAANGQRRWRRSRRSGAMGN